MGEVKNFNSRLIGFNKIEVDDYIESLEREHEKKIVEYITEIQQLEKDNDNLRKEIVALNDEIKSKTESKDIMEYAIEKAKEWTEISLKNATQKAAEIEAFSKEHEILINNKINIYNKVLKRSKEKLKNLLNIEIEKGTELIEEMNSFIESENKSTLKLKNKKDDKVIHYNETKNGFNDTDLTIENQTSEELKEETGDYLNSFDDDNLVITVEEKNALMKDGGLGDK